jgi:chloramphenicol-sensitive protein RarD
MVQEPDQERRRGLIYGTLAYLCWGLFPLYFPLLEPAGWLEILAERMIWSFVFIVIALTLGPGFAPVRVILRTQPRSVGLLALAAGFIAVNWGMYIYGVNSGHVVEASLGYFINPLFTILLGVLVLGERLRTAQWVAVGIGTVAVLVIAVDYGRPPWIALVLAFSFGMYGFCKKKADVPAVASITIETGVQLLPALVVIAVLGAQGSLVFGTRASTSVLLAGAGIVTIIPLLLFAAGTRRLPLSIVGLLQFLTPVLQFLVGVYIRHEPLPTTELIGFCLVWLALVVLSVDGLTRSRSERRDLQRSRDVRTDRDAARPASLDR